MAMLFAIVELIKLFRSLLDIIAKHESPKEQYEVDLRAAMHKQINFTKLLNKQGLKVDKEPS